MEDRDEFNDETFGSVSGGPPGMGPPPGLSGQDQNLPYFFSQNTGVTILDELAGGSLLGGELGGNEGALEEDVDYGDMKETFNTEENDDYVVDEKLPDFFSSDKKMYDDVDVLKIGHDTSGLSTSFPLPSGAQVLDPGVISGLQDQCVVPEQHQPVQQSQSPEQLQQHQQKEQELHHMQMRMNAVNIVQPPPHILLCPPGALPPAQSISALSTPGQMQSWYQQQNNQPRRPQNFQPNTNQLPRQQMPPPQVVAPGLGGSNVARGLSAVPPIPPVMDLTPVTESSDVPATRRGPPAVKGGVVPPVSQPTSLPIASGLSGHAPQPLHVQQKSEHPNMMPQQQFRHVAQQTKGPRLPCGSRMSHSDVRFVVGKILQTTETHDPFNDDFYFIQLSMRRHGAKLDKAITENKPLPAPLPIPLPTWTETKKRIRTQLDESRQHYEDRSRKWEIKEKVLGHNVKSDVSKPRAVLSVPRASASTNVVTSSTEAHSNKSGGNSNILDKMIDGLEDEHDESSQPVVTPFTTVLWNMRGAVHKGYGALYVAQELRQLLNTPLVNAPNNVSIRADIVNEANAAVALVCKSVGLKEPTDSVTASTDFLHKIQTNATTGVLLDGGLVAALLQTTKGKKLMRRSICLLQAEQRWTLLPVLVARILQRDPNDQSKEDTDVESALLATIVEFIQYEENCIINRVKAVSCIPPSVLLVHLRQCIKSVMVSQMETKQLRKALISSRKRAEVMHIILRLGDQVVSSFSRSDDIDDHSEMSLNFIDSQRQTDWTQLRDAFMLMLEN